MSEIFKKIESEIARKIYELESARADYDQADANNAYAQVEITLRIARIASELKGMENLYKKLRGSK